MLRTADVCGPHRLNVVVVLVVVHGLFGLLRVGARGRKLVNMVLNVHRLVRDRMMGWGWKKESKCLSLHCHHRNDFFINMGSCDSHFNVSLIVSDKFTRLCPQTTTFLKRKESRSGIEPRSFSLPA